MCGLALSTQLHRKESLSLFRNIMSFMSCDQMQIQSCKTCMKSGQLEIFSFDIKRFILSVQDLFSSYCSCTHASSFILHPNIPVHENKDFIAVEVVREVRNLVQNFAFNFQRKRVLSYTVQRTACMEDKNKHFLNGQQEQHLENKTSLIFMK